MCGEKLYDSSEVRCVGDSSFVQGTLVRIEPDGYKIVGDESMKMFPSDFCLALVEVSPCQSPHSP